MSIVVQHRRDSNANVEANTPATAEIWYDTTKKEMGVGDGATAGGLRMQKKNIREIVTPAQIVANQNDYSPSGLKHAAVLRLSTDASRNVTGIVALTATEATDGRVLVVYNAGSFNLVLQDQNVASSAANRFDLGGADITLAPKQSLSLRYSGTISRWEVADNNFGQAIADGAVSARKLAASALGSSLGCVNGKIVESHVGNAVTFALKTLAGNDPSATDPVFLIFPTYTTPADGAFVVRTITAAMAVTVSSGSSLGVTNNGAPFRVWIVAIDDTGASPRLGVVQCASGTTITPLSEDHVVAYQQEGGAGAADSAGVIYCNSAPAAGASFVRVLAHADYESGLVSVSLWAASPTFIAARAAGTRLPGAVIQRVRQQTGTATTGATLIPKDDTIPQITEGDQYLSQAITPSSPTSIFRVRAELQASSSLAADYVIAALFQDTTANALAASVAYQATATAPVRLSLEQFVAALSTAQTIFKVRAGCSGTLTFNGQSAVRVFGGVMNSFIDVEEIAA